jgi:hypothetical protein
MLFSIAEAQNSTQNAGGGVSAITGSMMITAIVMALGKLIMYKQ